MATFIETLNIFLFIVGLSFAYTFTKSKMDKKSEQKEPEEQMEVTVTQEDVPATERQKGLLTEWAARHELVAQIWQYAMDNNVTSYRLRQLLLDQNTKITVYPADVLHDEYPHICFKDTNGTEWWFSTNGLFNTATGTWNEGV